MATFSYTHAGFVAGMALFASMMLTFAQGCRAAEENQGPPTVKVVIGGEPTAKAEDCRRVLVGRGINMPDFPGFKKFVGWESPIRLANGTWLVGFNAGYNHASAPNAEAPTGGRAMLIRSTDEGLTWSKPETIWDTPYDDRHPSFCELKNGAILSTFFTWTGDLGKIPGPEHRANVIRSRDGGKTWEKTPPLPSPFIGDGTDGPMIQLKDGSALIAIYGFTRMDDVPKELSKIAILKTQDAGDSWEYLSMIKTGHEMSEPTIAQLPDGKLVMMTRPAGDICWSGDGGKTWTTPVSFGVRMYEPGFVVLKDGTLVCLHGSYGPGGMRVIFSRDGGHTWIAPLANGGFLIDSTYGYGRCVQLPDGSLFVAYIDNIGVTPEDMDKEAVWGIRFTIRPDYSGIELLPAPGVGRNR